MSCNTLPDFARALRRDPSNKGFLHLGKDGVLRTLSAEGQVVDAMGLRPDQISQLIQAMPGSGQVDEFQGIDGTRVAEEQWFNPADGILPTTRRAG